MSYMSGLRVVISRTEISAIGALLEPGLDAFKRPVEPASYDVAIEAKVVSLPPEPFDVVRDGERLVGTVLVPETKEQMDKRLGNPPNDRAIADALDTLSRAGWEVKHERYRGTLAGPLLCFSAFYDPDARVYERTWAQQPWKEVPDADRPAME